MKESGAQANAVDRHADAAGLAHAASRYTVTLEGHGFAPCGDAERVLEALERAQGFGRLKGMNFRLPKGCRRGGCGVCRVRVLEGDYRQTPMSRSHISEADEAEGVVLCCSIYPLTDLLLRLESPKSLRAKNAQSTRF